MASSGGFAPKSEANRNGAADIVCAVAADITNEGVPAGFDRGCSAAEPLNPGGACATTIVDGLQLLRRELGGIEVLTWRDPNASKIADHGRICRVLR
jgi:hypothetical protein